jgi:hypothetical protein
MAAAPASSIPQYTADNFAQRMAAMFPNGWASNTDKSPGGVLYGLFASIGGGLTFEVGALTYALGATRIQTAINGALDLASLDFLGTRLPRNPGETDASYEVRVQAALLPPGATRAAVTAAVKAATGYAPRVIEPWRPADTGVWGRFFWNVDTPTTPFRWTNSGMSFQGFIECVLPQPAFLGGNAAPCYDSNFYWGVAGSSFINPSASTPLGAAVVYDAINLVKVYGTTVWVKFVPTPPQWSWDQPNVTWDESGVNWT